MLWVLGDLSFVGYTAGNRWLYDYLLEDTAHYVYIYDTLTYVDNWDGTGSRCAFSTPAERANFILSDYPDLTVSDTSFAYYDGTYLVDFAKAEIHPFKGAGIRTLKFPLTVGETWQAIDTCIYALGERMPHPEGSIDTDTLTDTLWYDTSYASLVSHVGDTVVVAFLLNMNVKLTDLTLLDDTTYMCCRTYYHSYSGRVEYMVGFGMKRFRIDSAVMDISYGLINTNTWDTTFVPRTFLDSMYVGLIWENVFISILERPSANVGGVVVSSRKVMVHIPASVYSADGRLIARLQKDQSVRLRPGVYFVRTTRGVKKVVIR
ncbi:MAG: hypothetical protein GXO39_01250 [Thermotogae bacterium]|nr:hypothetical protein [Thermotogota bacterium]